MNNRYIVIVVSSFESAFHLLKYYTIMNLELNGHSLNLKCVISCAYSCAFVIRKLTGLAQFTCQGKTCKREQAGKKDTIFVERNHFSGGDDYYNG